MKNNVHVSGILLYEEKIDYITTRLTLQTKTTDNKIIPVKVIVATNDWESFKMKCPNNYNSISVDGFLDRKGKETIIKGTFIGCFFNILEGTLNETGTKFYGPATLKKKLDFGNNANLFVRRMAFETTNGVILETIAMRSSAPYFDQINEGDRILLKASYVADKKEDFPPYWRISHRPELLN